MSADTLLGEGARRLAAAGIEGARAEARLLLAHAMDIPRDQTLSTCDPTPGQAAAFDGFIARRAAREPFAYITGRREFWSLDFTVGPGVLIPRPETEILIEQALALHPGRPHGLAIADLGTGSGCLLIAAMREFPASLGLGLDASSAALAWATRNGLAYNLSARAEMRLDGWDAAPAQAFDIMFCNPPYIPTADIAGLEADVSHYEPLSALDGGADGLDAYRGLGAILARSLKPGGLAFVELGVGQADSMAPLFQPHGLEIRHIAPDLSGIPRCLVLARPR